MTVRDEGQPGRSPDTDLAGWTDDPVLDETLAALGMRPGVLRRWLEDRRRFCMSHGGRRYYAEVLDLVEACLERSAPPDDHARSSEQDGRC